ncbi:hypothetical protein BDN71DRAFT_1591618 [Pleurotus eryngii]|uniref:Uncharacterized protein n=1 Tax=Pleurotus eryngii TaxID=5323 RepID=A0A9P5ZRT3_PLEER|nr:hypothetical protein BDN71DRAFT_1591618 [Pleurotus eryngii]
MAPKEKVDAEQKAFLELYASKYREVQKHGTFLKFWPCVFLGWFSRWPEQEDESIEDAELQKKKHKKDINCQQQYIKNWYRNHALPKVWSHAPEEVVFVQQQKEKAKRCPQLLEYYQNQYYKEKIAPDVSEALVNDNTEGTLGVVHKKTKEAWHLEDVAIKARITAEHMQLCKDFKKAREEKKQLEKEEAKARTDPTPSSYAAYKFGAFSADAGPASGWSFVLIAGGPDPSNNGCINTMAYHYGSNVFGLSVTEYDPEFKAKVTPIFNHFLQTCYSPEQCANRALLCAPATTARSPIVVEEAAKEVLSEAALSLVTPQEISPVPNLPSLAELNLPGQVLPATVPAGPSLSLKVPPGLLSPSLSSSPDPPPDPALIEIPPDFEFDWGSFAPYNHYAGMQCTIPPANSHMSLLDEMAALLPIDCYSQGVAMPVATFLHPPILQPVIHQPALSVLAGIAPPISQHVVHLLPIPLPISQPVVHQPTPSVTQPAPSVLTGIAPPISQPVVHQPPIPQPVIHQPTPSVAPPISQPVTPALALINPTTDVPTTNGINGSGDSEATTLSMDAISTDFTSKPTNPQCRKRPRDDGTDPSFIVTTKRACKP